MDDARALARELAAELAALATPGPEGPGGAGASRPSAGADRPSLSGPRAILENGARFVSPTLPADAPFRSLKALVLRALRIVTRDQTVFNSAVAEALRTALLEVEALLAREAAGRRELESALNAARAAGERNAERLDAEEAARLALGGLLGAAERRLASAEDRFREAAGRLGTFDDVTADLHATQRRVDTLETRSDEALGRIAGLLSRVDGHGSRIDEAAHGVERLSQLAEEVRVLRLEWSALRSELRKEGGRAKTPARVEPVAAAASGPEPQADDPLSAGLYAEFERTFRGSEADIRHRQEKDLALFAAVPGPVADLGCGRGEFLEALRDAGREGVGCDSNPVAVAICREKGLAVDEADLFGWLEARPDGSLGGVAAYQVVEHLQPRQLTVLVETAVRKLAPGGRLLLETVNPESVAAMRWFWMDLTHVRPVPGPSLAKLMEACGLRDVEVELRSPVPEAVSGPVAASTDPVVRAMAGLVFAPQDVAVTGVR